MTATTNEGFAASPEPVRHSRGGALWHPFSNMAAVVGNEFVIDRADGVWVYDPTGRPYLDATANLWCVNVGHGRAQIREAVDRQMRRLDCYSIFGDYANRPALELADTLAMLAPLTDAKVFLCNGGGESVDTAARLARQYFFATDRPDRTHIISRSAAFHGTHGWGVTLAGIADNRTGNGEMIPDASQIPFDDPLALEDEIIRVGPDRVAAFFCEPVIGAGGVHLPPTGYLEAVADICSRHGVLFVVDAVIAGFGRLGTWFGIERWNLKPDMITFAKGVTSGYLPLGGVIVAQPVADPFWRKPGRAFRHGPTYAGHPACSAAALANIELLQADELVAQGRVLEQPLAERLGTLAGHPAASTVRAGLGLIAAVEISPHLLAQHPTAVATAFAAAREAGVLVRPLSTSMAVSPPLTITESELDTLVEGIRAGLDALTAL